MLRFSFAIFTLSLALCCGCGGDDDAADGGGNGGSGGNGGGGSQPSTTASATAPAREPQAGGGSLGGGSLNANVTLAPADAATWRVTGDGAPAPADLKSCIPLPVKKILAAAFTRPDVAQVAVLEKIWNEETGVQVIGSWVRIDLVTGETIDRVPLTKDDTPREELLLLGSYANNAITFAVSPSGERLAWIGGITLFIWSKDGERLMMKKLTGVSQNMTWCGFHSDDKLWITVDGRLQLITVPEGEVLDTKGVTAGLSPGGKWLTGYGNQELTFYDAADGKPAGAIPIPPGWSPAGWAFHPDCKHIGISMRNQSGDLLLGIYDLDSGQPVQSASETYAKAQRTLPGWLQWVGKDTLLLNGTLFHLESKTILADMNSAGTGLAGPQPDTRMWHIRAVTDPEQGKQIAAKTGGEPATQYLCAATMSPQALDSLMSQPGGFAWHPGVAVNAVVHGVPEKFAAEIGDGLADYLARSGYRVDPQAPIKLELKVALAPDGQTTGKDIPKNQLTPAMKEHLKTFPSDKWVELVTVKNLTIEGMVYDSAGKPAFKVPTFLFSRAVDEAGNSDPLWQGLATWQGAMKLPGAFFRDPTGKRVQLPRYITPGIDGVLDPVPEFDPNPLWVKDEFALPGDG
jgi:hypothetical protein